MHSNKWEVSEKILDSWVRETNKNVRAVAKHDCFKPRWNAFTYPTDNNDGHVQPEVPQEISAKAVL